jgi:AraC-like DNA-binding protein
MSLRAMSLIMEHSPTDWACGLRYTAVIIADHINDDGECWPSIQRIAKRTGLSDRQVQRHLNQLELCHVLTRIPSFAKGRQTTNVYRFEHNVTMWKTCGQTWGQGVDNVTTGVTSTSPPHDIHVTPEGDTHVTHGGDTHVTQNPNRNHPYET